MKKILYTVLDFWKKFGLVLGAIQSFIIISVVYFSVVAITSLFIKLLGIELLGNERSESYWIAKPNTPKNLHSCRKQF